MGEIDTTFTTIVVRNLPKDIGRSAFLQVMDDEFQGFYDFAYLPMDFKKQKAFGYAIFNFCDEAHAQEAKLKLPSMYANDSKTVEVDWSDQHQGLEELISRYRNSPVLGDDT